MIGPVFGIGTGNMRGYIGDFYPEPSRAKELLEILEEGKKEKNISETKITISNYKNNNEITLQNKIIELQQKIIELQSKVIELESKLK